MNGPTLIRVDHGGRSRGRQVAAGRISFLAFPRSSLHNWTRPHILRLSLLHFLTCSLLLAPTVRADGDDLPDDPAAQARLLALVGDDFRIRQTPHFLVCSDADHEVISNFIARVEGTYLGVERFINVHDLDQTKLPHRLEILFFDRYQDFQKYAASVDTEAVGAAGFYDGRTNRAAFYNALNAPQLAQVNETITQMEQQLRASIGNRSNRRSAYAKELRRLRAERDRVIETINQLVVQHEVAHQVFYNIGVHQRRADDPTWLVEGLACLMETPPDRNGAGFGTVNQYRLLNFREALAGPAGPRRANTNQFSEACRTGRLVPLRRLIADDDLFAIEGATVENAYAQAWSLVHFLQRRHREEFGVYLLVLARRPTDRAYSGEQEVMIFEEVFGAIDETFEKQWLDYILDERVRYPRTGPRR